MAGPKHLKPVWKRFSFTTMAGKELELQITGIANIVSLPEIIGFEVENDSDL